MKVGPSSRFWSRLFLGVSLSLGAASALPAQTGTGSLRGTVVDPSGGAVPNATVKATSASGQAVSAATNGTGAYSLSDLPPGPYTVEINLAGFAPFSKEGVTVTSNRTQQFDIALQIAQEKQQVTVSGEALTVDTSPSNNASAVVLTEKELDALPDDPDELQSDLEALAGPSAGPNGGQMYIDGFTAGQLPPKSSIREIRINSNPFSAEYDTPGFGRIEILTKPGGNAWHGSVSVNRNQDIFNTRNPFAPTKGDFQSTQYEGNVGGGLGKKISVFINTNYRSIDNSSVINAVILDSNFNVENFHALNPLPQSRLNVGPRVDWQVSKNNTFTVRYQYLRNSTTNSGVGNFILPVQGSNTLTDEDQLQVTDSQYFGTRIVYETRFQYLHELDNNIAANLIPSVTIPGSFTGGGSGNNLDTQNHYELQSYTSIAFLKHFLKFGARLREVTDGNNSNESFFGAFQFASLAAYQTMAQGLSNGMSMATILAQPGCTTPGTCGPSQYAVTAGNPYQHVSTFDAGPFIQDDWKFRPNITLSYGLRLETQTHISDHLDWAPRAAIAWGIGGAKGVPKYVLRAGWGMFYTRFGEADILQALRQNGVTEQQYLVAYPNFYCGSLNPLGTTLAAACPSPAALAGNSSSVPTIYQIAPNFHAPYMLQSNVSVERQLNKAVQVSVTYLNSRGFDQLLEENVNSPVLGGIATSGANGGKYPNGITENIYQYASAGKFRQNQLIGNTTIRGSKLTLNAYYVLNFADSTPNGFVSDPYNISLDYGRAAGNFGVRNRAFLIGTVRLPYGMTLAPAVQIASGSPYSVTIGKDLLGTGLFNQRPGFISSSTCPTTQITGSIYCTSVGTFDSVPTASETILPVNSLSGPPQFTVNLRLTKTFTFGPPPPEGAQRRPGGGGGAGRVGPPPGGALGGGGRGGNPGGGFGGGGGRGAPVGGRYSFTVSLNARNIFNRVNLAAPVGNLTSPIFGESEALSNAGQGGSVVANRQVYLQGTFNF